MHVWVHVCLCMCVFAYVVTCEPRYSLHLFVLFVLWKVRRIYSVLTFKKNILNYEKNTPNTGFLSFRRGFLCQKMFLQKQWQKQKYLKWINSIFPIFCKICQKRCWFFMYDCKKYFKKKNNQISTCTCCSIAMFWFTFSITYLYDINVVLF